ncbi:terpene synthase family protein [Nocardia sp. NBC_01377]|uniref:terpene synthase family protein n=1 Tax=Nocardia sp. NBC_01377 TaxID=2903595 RepID=UPI00324E2133
MSVDYTAPVEAKLLAMREEYQQILRSPRRWSLRDLFSTPELDIVEYCRDLTPNRFGEPACREVERWCRQHRIWLEPGATHYNSMTPYLHPNTVTVERMTVIGLFNAILYWLNDTVGRDKHAHLSHTQQQHARATIDRLCDMLETGTVPPEPVPVEVATHEFLQRLSRDADPRWLQETLASTVAHLRPANRDQNARARGQLLDVQDYIALRADMSGMYPVIAFCEYGRDTYLQWGPITATGLDTDLLRLRQLTVQIGGLMNDLFSFEKECITGGADSNLIPILLLNSTDATLADAIEHAAALVREQLTEFHSLRTGLTARRAALADTALATIIGEHIDDLTGAVQATWVWQVRTARYKRSSIFTENHQH